MVSGEQVSSRAFKSCVNRRSHRANRDEAVAKGEGRGNATSVSSPRNLLSPLLHPFFTCYTEEFHARWRHLHQFSGLRREELTPAVSHLLPLEGTGGGWGQRALAAVEAPPTSTEVWANGGAARRSEEPIQELEHLNMSEILGIHHGPDCISQCSPL